MPDLKKIADEADMIVCGFAYKKCDEGVRIFDLNDGNGAAFSLPFLLAHKKTLKF